MSGMGSMVHDNWPWLALIALGAYHGMNPAMGWLFAVSLGLQEGRREAVVKAFWPIALGHAAAVTLVVVAVLALQAVVPLEVLKYLGATALILFGLYKLIRRKHPRWVGMRLGFKDLMPLACSPRSPRGHSLRKRPIFRVFSIFLVFERFRERLRERFREHPPARVHPTKPIVEIRRRSEMGEQKTVGTKVDPGREKETH